MKCSKCKFQKQYIDHVGCSHKNRNMTCTKQYIGRGVYIYPEAYNDCDCNGFCLDKKIRLMVYNKFF
jgi:hypothetical protein